MVSKRWWGLSTKGSETESGRWLGVKGRKWRLLMITRSSAHLQAIWVEWRLDHGRTAGQATGRPECWQALLQGYWHHQGLVLENDNNQAFIFSSGEWPGKSVDGGSKVGWHELLNSGILGRKQGWLFTYASEEGKYPPYLQAQWWARETSYHLWILQGKSRPRFSLAQKVEERVWGNRGYFTNNVPWIPG